MAVTRPSSWTSSASTPPLPAARWRWRRRGPSSTCPRAGCSGTDSPSGQVSFSPHNVLVYFTLQGEEFNLREDLAWTFFHTTKFGHQFYLSVQYYSVEQLFLFYVMVDSGQEVAEDYRANISISNEDQSVSISFSGPVLAIDRYNFVWSLCDVWCGLSEFPRQRKLFWRRQAAG